MRIPVTVRERRGLASHDTDAAPSGALHSGIASQGWGKTVTVVAGIAIVVAAGVGALMIARGRNDRETPSTTVAPAPAGTDVPVTLRSGGIDRTYVVHVPATYDGSQAVALVIVLHGSGGDAEEAARISGMSAKSDAE